MTAFENARVGFFLQPVPSGCEANENRDEKQIFVLVSSRLITVQETILTNLCQCVCVLWPGDVSLRSRLSPEIQRETHGTRIPDTDFRAAPPPFNTLNQMQKRKTKPLSWHVAQSFIFTPMALAHNQNPQEVSLYRTNLRIRIYDQSKKFNADVGKVARRVCGETGWWSRTEELERTCKDFFIHCYSPTQPQFP